MRGKGDPIQLDYRLEKTPAGWKIYDINVLGVWLVENYRNSFAQEIGANGIDGLIAKLAERNKAAAAGGAPRAERAMLLLPGDGHQPRSPRHAAHALAGDAARAGRRVVVNAGSLQHFDSSALAVLLECERLAQALGQGVLGPPGAAEAGGAGEALRGRRAAAAIARRRPHRRRGAETCSGGRCSIGAGRCSDAPRAYRRSAAPRGTC